MKLKNIFRFVILTAIAISIFASCNSEDYKTGADEVTDTVKEGTWTISYFYDSGVDKTADYAAYNFVFSDKNILTAVKETNSYTGQWFVSNSTSDGDIYSTIFKVSIGPNEIFQDLNADWKVMENKGSSLTLKDDSHGETAIDYLTLQKIE